MDSSDQAMIVVGVSGPGQETAALMFAAEVAKREGAEVLLVHAYRPALRPPPPAVLLTYDELSDVAARVAKEVGEEFAKLTQGAIGFRAIASAGSPARVLVDLSEGARMVVVQHPESRSLGHLFVGSTANGAAAHAHCPVVSVNSGWRPPAETGEVVVGVHEAGAPQEAVLAGLAWARATGSRLKVVHAWRLDAAYDDIISPQVSEDWREQQEHSLAAAVAEMQTGQPEVPVEVEVRHEWPPQALVNLSRTASLVVLGRHGHLGWMPERLGSVARTVLREAASPVMVVPLHQGPNDDWGLEADDISPQT